MMLNVVEKVGKIFSDSLVLPWNHCETNHNNYALSSASH